MRHTRTRSFIQHTHSIVNRQAHQLFLAIITQCTPGSIGERIIPTYLSLSLEVRHSTVCESRSGEEQSPPQPR